MTVFLNRQILLYFFFFFLFFLWSAQAVAANWSGEWDSTWRHRAARITLEQTGDQVSGEYPLFGGTVKGSALGQELHGTWSEGGREGTFVAIMAGDGRTFTARFGTGEWLTAVRVSDDNEFMGYSIDQSSPAMTLYHFLAVMNAVGPGRMELQSEASHFIDFSTLPGQTISELDYTSLLFNVVNSMTFRVWEIQSDDNADTFTATLNQAGTSVSLDLKFLRRNGDWFIQALPIDLLEDVLMRAQAAHASLLGGRSGDLLSPRDTLKTLVRSFSYGGVDGAERAMETLNMADLSALAREYEGRRLARYVYRSLRRLGAITWQEVPDNPIRSEPYVFFEHPLGRIAIGPVLTKEGVIWQFTPDTLRTIRSLYAALDNLPANNIIELQAQPESLYFRTRDAIREMSPTFVRPVGVMELWQWLGLLLTLVVAYAVGKLVNLFFYGVLKRSGGDAHGPVVRGFFLWSFRVFSLGVALRLADRVLSFPDLVQVALVTISWSCIVLSLMVLTLLTIKLVAARIRNVETLKGNNITLVSFIAGILRIIVIVFAILMLADVLQVPYQSVLAGLGIGGLAVALAAQSTLQNFISGITLYFDKPIAVGDYCRFGDKTGTVEFIGMRSTRIRTLDRTLLTVPNSEFSNMQIENYAKRDSMFLHPTISLRYETTPDQLRYVLAELRKMLLSHPKVAADPLRVRFGGFGSHSLDISVFAYVMSVDYSEYLGIREDIYLRMMQIVSEAGTKLAVPSMVHYNAADSLPDADRVQASEAQVHQWREEGKLPFPDFAWQDKAEMRETLDYPPQGSAVKEELSNGPVHERKSGA
mgnify:FL=1